MSEGTSLTLLDKLRANEPEAWERLVYLYSGLIRYWCSRMGVPGGSVEDVQQEVFAVVHRRKMEFRRERPEDTFRGWLRGITRNIIREHFRKVNNQPIAEGGTEAGLRLQEVPDLGDEDEDDPEEERAALLHRALRLILKEFTEREQQVVQLIIVEGLDAGEAAERLGMKSGAVRVAKCRVLKRLREELGK